ncbi:MAG: RNA-binding S4 domain-containing protein [Anaerovoracaceae bacterium]
MRIDKYLKVSRIIKRRTVAKEACEKACIILNAKVAKPGSEVSVGDIIEINMGSKNIKLRVQLLLDTQKKELASEMFEIL